MSRFEKALAGLRAGQALLLTDEARAGEAAVVAWARGRSGGPGEEALRQLVALGRGAASQVGAPATSDLAGLPDALRALGVGAAPARDGGVLVRPGFAEAAADLLAAADLGGAIVMRGAALPGGVLARAGEAERFARRHGLAAVSIQDVVAHRLASETVVEEVAVATMPSLYAAEPLEVHAFRNLLDGSEHVAMLRRPHGRGILGETPLVRLHSECLTGDALGSLRCDCGEQLRHALTMIGEDPDGGAVLYLRGQEGRGIGLANKIKAYALQERGFDTVEANAELGFPADLRDYGAAVQMLRALGITRLRLLSNNPQKRAGLERYGITVVGQRNLRVGPNPHNADYLETKRVKMGHDLAAALRVASEG